MKEEKIMILQMLQDEKITPEEAISLLEALDEEDFDIPEFEEVHEEDHKTRLSNKTLEEIGIDIGNAFGNLFTNIKDIGSSIGINNLTETMELDLEEDLSNISSPIVDLKAVNGYIKLRRHEGDKVHINIFCRYKEGSHVPNRDFYKFYRENNRLVFYPLYNSDISINLDVKLPKKLYDEIILETNNSSIEAEDIQVNRLECETKNSSIKIKKIEAKKLKVSSLNGRIEGNSLKIDNIQAITTNSGIFFDEIESEDFSAHTANGKIRLKDMTSHRITVKTSNASIEADNISSKYVDLRTSNAKIVYHFFDVKEAKEIKLSTSNGTIVSNLSEKNKEMYFDLESSIGNIGLDYPNLIYKTNKQANFGLKKLEAYTPEYDNSDDGIRFTAYTSNGSIKIS